MILSKEILQLSLLNEDFNLLFQVVTLIYVMLVISVETIVLAFVSFAMISFHLLCPFQGLVVLDLHQHLDKWGIQGSVVRISF